MLEEPLMPRVEPLIRQAGSRPRSWWPSPQGLVSTYPEWPLCGRARSRTGVRGTPERKVTVEGAPVACSRS